MIKLTINIDDTIENFSLADLEKWHCQALRCFKNEDISEQILSMTEKHFEILEEQRRKQVFADIPYISLERCLQKCDELLDIPVNFAGMKILVRK